MVPQSAPTHLPVVVPDMFMVCAPIIILPLKDAAIVSEVGASICSRALVLLVPWVQSICTSRADAVLVMMVFLQSFSSMKVPLSNFSFVMQDLVVEVRGPIMPAIADFIAAACSGVILLVSGIGTSPLVVVVDVISQRPILTFSLGLPCARSAAVRPAIITVVPIDRIACVMERAPWPTIVAHGLGG